MPKKQKQNIGFAKKKSINDLILFAIFTATKIKEQCTFAKLVKECFAISPSSFSISGYSKWPDTRKLDRPLRTLKKRKLIKGEPATFFSLTSQGKIKAQEIAKTLCQKTLL